MSTVDFLARCGSASILTAWLGLGALAGCGGNSETSAYLIFSGAELSPGGGYRVLITDPVGGTIENLEDSRFVPYQAGEQDLVLVIENEELFAQSQTVTVRFCVTAVPAPEADPIAIGSGLITLESGESVSGEVTLRPDGRPSTDPEVTLRYADDGSGSIDQVVVEWAAEPTAAPRHLWTVGESGGLKNWVTKLAENGEQTSASLPAENVASSFFEDDTPRFAITTESADSPDRLVGSCGWRTHEGKLEDAVRSFLRTGLEERTGGEPGLMPAMFALHEVATAHLGLARTGFDLGDQAELGKHTEHVFNTIAGEPNEEDVDNDGDFEFISPDRTAFSNVSASPPGYVELVLTLASDLLEAVPTNPRRTEIRGELVACATNVRNGATALFDAARDLVADGTNLDKMVDFEASVSHLSGDPFDPLASDPARQTLICSRDRMAGLSTFVLEPLAAGE